MSYPHEQAQPAAAPSLLKDMAAHIDRLRELCNRLASLADNIHGPAPRSASTEKNIAEPVPSLRRYCDVIGTLVTEAEAELDRISNRM